MLCVQATGLLGIGVSNVDFNPEEKVIPPLKKVTHLPPVYHHLRMYLISPETCPYHAILMHINDDDDDDAY